MTRASFGGRLPDSFKSEIFEYPDGTFDFRTDLGRCLALAVFRERTKQLLDLAGIGRESLDG
jgi:hypothetical protein